jgi:hypothetical protein
MTQRLKKPPTPAWRQRSKRNKRARTRQVSRARAAGGGRRVLWAAGATVAVLALVALLTVAKISSDNSNSSTNKAAPHVNTPASTAGVDQVAAVAPTTLSRAAAGSSVAKPQKISGSPLTVGGKPEVLYIGAEYCPFCAAERWAMVMALSKFGSFNGLGATHSSSSDVDANTPTFSFHGATYTSNYLSFRGVETTTNQRQGSSYAPLDKPTSAEQALIQKYDAPPYVSSANAGSIPFIYLDGRFLQISAAYDPHVLAGQSMTQIATGLSDPNTASTKNIEASAGVLVGDLCTLTHGQPGSVCSSFSKA